MRSYCLRRTLTALHKNGFMNKQSFRLTYDNLFTYYLLGSNIKAYSDYTRYDFQPQTISTLSKSNFNLATHILKPWATKRPDHPAVILTDGNHREALNYAQLLRQANRLASSLNYDEKKKPRCAIVILPKTFAWWVINIAGSICETIISPGTMMLREKDIAYRVKMCKADAIFCNYSTMQELSDSLPSVPWKIIVGESEDEEIGNARNGWISYHNLISKGGKFPDVEGNYKGDSIAQLYFTSGTTGHPKMVPHTQEGLGVGHEVTCREWLRLGPEDIVWNISDLGWAKASYSSLYAPFIAGCSAFSHKMDKFDAKTVLKTLQDTPVSVICLPPTAYRSLIQEDLTSFKPKSLRKCVSAGEPLNPEVTHIWHKYTGIWIQEGYGQTESTLVCCSSVGMKVKPGMIGKPTGGFDIKIIDENFNELGSNKVGQIAYSLKNGWPCGLFKGYLNSPELNEKVFVNDYYLTGDRAYMDEDGYVCYVGRDDDIIITAGYRIGPFEVESALIQHPAILESAVVGSPDEKRGHVIKAFIILNEENKNKISTPEGYSDLVKNIQDFVKKNIAPYKYPRKIEFVDSLPKTISGKIRRIELREKEQKGNKNSSTK